MFVRHHAQRLSRTLLTEFPLVHRVLVARTDGLLFFDSADADDAHAASAVAAAMVGLAEHVSITHEHGEMHSAIVRSAGGVMIVYPAGPNHTMAVYAAANINLILLDRVARQLVSGLVRDEGSATVPEVRPAPQPAVVGHVTEDRAASSRPSTTSSTVQVRDVDHVSSAPTPASADEDVVAVPVLTRRARREFVVRA